MFLKKLLPVLLVLTAAVTRAQTNFVYSPEKPKPGDKVSFTYEPAGDLTNNLIPPDVVLYQSGSKRKADDVKLERIGRKFNGSFTIDTGTNFVNLSFAVDKKFDNNFNEGYTILVYDNDKPRKGAYFNKALFYQYMGAQQAGIEASNEKALAAMDKEFELYPENKKMYTTSYVRLQTLIKKDEAPKILQKEIESLVKSGLKEESDYSTLEYLYTLAKLPEQTKFINGLKKEKFPDGAWSVTDVIQKFYAEKDIEKKKQLLNDMLAKAEKGGDKWKFVRENPGGYKMQIAYAYLTNKDWANLKKAIAETGVTDKTQLAGIYNSAAWEMQKTSADLPLAEEFSRLATAYAKEAWKDPNSVTRPEYYTKKQFAKNNQAMYAMYGDTYGMVMYRMGNYKKGLEISKETALTINEGKDADQNNTYALNAEKAMPKKQYVKALEQFVKDGKATGEIKTILKNAYVKDNKSEKGFDDYITALEKEAYTKLLEEIRKSMLNETASAFALVDLEGKKVQLADLKGKVVVMDFWATWCGPCKASFPGMQKMVTRYKDDPNVKFVFVDTWERVEDKAKNAADFIAANKYTFHVLLDNEDKVVAEYKVDGIPTKFVIDKKGMVRFKAIGFDGSDDKLIQELTAMIDMAANDDGKKGF